MSPSLVPHLFLLGWLKLNLILLLDLILLFHWTLAVAVISVDGYPFFRFFRSDQSPWGYGNSCFLVALRRLLVRRPNLEVATKGLLFSRQKYRGSFRAMSHMEVCRCNCFRCCGYFWGPWVSLVTTDVFLVRVTKITSTIGVSWTHSLPFYF